MSTQRSHIHATSAKGIASERRTRTAGTPAQMATVILATLKTKGPQSKTDLDYAIRDAGLVQNENTFALAIGWLREHRGLVTKPAKPKGRTYLLAVQS